MHGYSSTAMKQILLSGFIVFTLAMPVFPIKHEVQEISGGLVYNPVISKTLSHIDNSEDEKESWDSRSSAFHMNYIQYWNRLGFEAGGLYTVSESETEQLTENENPTYYTADLWVNYRQFRFGEREYITAQAGIVWAGLIGADSYSRYFYSGGLTLQPTIASAGYWDVSFPVTFRGGVHIPLGDQYISEDGVNPYSYFVSGSVGFLYAEEPWGFFLKGGIGYTRYENMITESPYQFDMYNVSYTLEAGYRFNSTVYNEREKKHGKLLW